MIGRLDASDKRVTVVGAGISGLLIADRLDRLGYEVTLLEAQDRAGGLIRTVRNEYGIAESAAHSFLVSPAVRSWCEELGVRLIDVRKTGRARYIYRDGKMRKFPLRFGELIGTLARVFRKGDHEAATLDDWARQHLGSAALQYLLNPFVRGIYGAEPQELGVAAAFPNLRVAAGMSLFGAMRARKKEARARGEAGKSRSPMMAPATGIGGLVEKLDSRLTGRLGARYRKGVCVSEIPDAPNVVLSVPAYAAAGLLETHDARLAASLRAVEYCSIISVSAFVERSAFTRPVEGVGVLVPSSSTERDCMGILFTSSSFEGRVRDESRHASFTVMLRDRPLDQVPEVVRRELEALLGIRQAPVRLETFRWARAIPKYSAALPETWRLAREGWASRPGRILFGNYTGQVSLRGMIETVAGLG